jgi:hypothetical protein
MFNIRGDNVWQRVRPAIFQLQCKMNGQIVRFRAATGKYNRLLQISWPILSLVLIYAQEMRENLHTRSIYGLAWHISQGVRTTGIPKVLL